MLRFSLLGLLLAVVLVGCDTTATQPESQIVVEAYLQGGTPLPNIRLTRSVDTDQSYISSEVSVTGAQVEIRRLADDGTTAATTSYVETDQGVYGPDPPVPIAQPLTTYELSVETFEGATLTATTTVPDTISIVDAQNAVVPYQSPNQPTFSITSPQSDGGEQAVLVLTTTSLLDFRRPNSQLRDALTPFYEADYDPEEDSIDTFRTTSSGVLNEANFGSDEQGRITTKLPWISVAFYGPNEAAVHVIDDNFYDLIRSQGAQSTTEQGSGLAPGEIPNVIEHIEGGTGIFGSYVQDTQQVFVQCPPNESECPTYINQ